MLLEQVIRSTGYSWSLNCPTSSNSPKSHVLLHTNSSLHYRYFVCSVNWLYPAIFFYLLLLSNDWEHCRKSNMFHCLVRPKRPAETLSSNPLIPRFLVHMHVDSGHSSKDGSKSFLACTHWPLVFLFYHYAVCSC